MNISFKTLLILSFTLLIFISGCSDNSTDLPPSQLPPVIAFTPDYGGTNIDSLFICDDKGQNQDFITVVKGIHSIFWPPEKNIVYYQENYLSPVYSAIFSVDIDTKEKRELYKASGLFKMETISRDGKEIILRMRDSGSEILELFRLETINGTAKKISNGQTEDGLPALASNSTMMAYAGSIPGQNYTNVYLYSGTRTRITDFTNAVITAITFSPFNSHIYFSCQIPNDTLYNNYLMRYSISAETIDTLFSYTSSILNSRIGHLTWSETKSRLAFTAGSGDSEDSHIYTIDLDGKNPRQISTVTARYNVKGYDGIYIYYSYDNSNDNGIYKMSLDGEDIIPLIDCATCANIVWNYRSDYK